ncbi:MAG TPA: hypothetical protein VFA94_07000 [Acidimicrobiales bacterium]|nr:hypothetical protein [Acidimicrobiales bacterium]
MPTAVRAAPGGTPHVRVRPQWWWAVVAAVVVLVVFAANHLLAGPSFIARITVVNPTEYALDVDAAKPDKPAWTPIGTARQRGTTVLEQVIDEGDQWVFRFRTEGIDGGELRMSRSALEQANWRIEVPASVGDTLRAAGAAPTP